MIENTRCRPPLAGWMGGKSLLAERIIERVPDHVCYCEPFAGAAWVLFSKPESRVEVINDINREVITLYRVLQWHLDEFVRYFRWALVARDEFERLKAVNPDTLPSMRRSLVISLLLALPLAYFLGSLEPRATDFERTWLRVCAYPFLSTGTCLVWVTYRLIRRICKR